MSNRKYLRLADGYHDRSPYNPHQSSGKYSSKQVNNVSDSRSERSSNVNGGSGSRNNSPRSRHNVSPRSHRAKSSYSKTKELYKRGCSVSPIESNAHQNSNCTDRMLKTNSVSSDDIFPWSQHTSSSGKTYYYNCKTEKSQWEKPKEWIEREQLSREKRRKEAIEHVRESSNHISKEKSRDHRDRTSSKSGESIDDKNRRVPQHHYNITKTMSANTSATTTIIQRPEQQSAKNEPKVSPVNSLQDVSPPVTPSTRLQNNSSPIIGSSPIIKSKQSPIISKQSPIISKHSPIVSKHSPIVLKQSPSLSTPGPPPPPLPTHHSNSPTPPPPPPPLPPPQSSNTIHGIMTQTNVHPFAGKMPDNVAYNGTHAFSQSHLHPLQQATLLQAQFQISNVQTMMTGTTSTTVVSHYQPNISENYVSPSVQQLQTSSPPVIPSYVTPQQINLQQLAAPFNRGLMMHTVGWPSEPMEKQSQKLSEESLCLHSTNNQLKADLIPLNYHHNLTAMRMSVGDKRIRFLREQTKKLEDWVS